MYRIDALSLDRPDCWGRIGWGLGFLTLADALTIAQRWAHHGWAVRVMAAAR